MPTISSCRSSLHYDATASQEHRLSPRNHTIPNQFFGTDFDIRLANNKCRTEYTLAMDLLVRAKRSVQIVKVAVKAEIPANRGGNLLQNRHIAVVSVSMNGR
ncbi:potassium voltage-gated channel subfamily KQTmember 1 [Striga asiatica]|uniref:Potassium voltage-gated channel subfamily KQTmember 1 n=1 Tax=Striga asiatica TaxID=4170 RepID=A0A5A7QDI3_STRAF|nr:potassium voltage-gated channel subfamily KQTmember 1 [Striga asiatica]